MTPRAVHPGDAAWRVPEVGDVVILPINAVPMVVVDSMPPSDVYSHGRIECQWLDVNSVPRRAAFPASCVTLVVIDYGSPQASGRSMS